MSELCRVEILGPCASLSLLGQNIRGILHELGSAFELFQDQKIYLVTQAANDLNFTFVIDESQGDRLVHQLHERLIQSIGSDKVLGPTWTQLFADKDAHAAPRLELVGAAAEAPRAARYRGARVRRLCLRRADLGCGDCRGAGRAFGQALGLCHEGQLASGDLAQDLRRRTDPGMRVARRARACLRLGAGARPERVLFTPNFAPRAEYEFGFAKGVRVTLDNLYPLKMWPEVFRGREIFLRIDPGFGRGHHSHVRTAGVHTKFGVPLSAKRMNCCAQPTSGRGVRVTGLHAHTGSGIFDVANWTETGALLARSRQALPAGRGRGSGRRHWGSGSIGSSEIDLGHARPRRGRAWPKDFPHIEFWMEPGRFLVARAGVLVALVTQLKGKGDVHYVGIATGMNSLIRPALVWRASRHPQSDPPR